MSLFGDLVVELGKAALSDAASGGGGTTVTNTSNSSTDVSVNPEIVTVTQVDLAPFANLVSQLSAGSREAEKKAQENVVEIQKNSVETIKVLGAAAIAAFVFVRKFT